MEAKLIIPESVLQAIRLPEKRIQSELLKELALSLYENFLCIQQLT